MPLNTLLVGDAAGPCRPAMPSGNSVGRCRLGMPVGGAVLKTCKMCPFARDMRSSSPPSVAEESSARRHIIETFANGSKVPVRLLEAQSVRELRGGQAK